ncbi:hypothetical protein POM88_002628 [Heracleum sosnowskyi]|uniref:Uncharacterized protein n=1 Tax=Heracleum sosnowskyi TaxID=360622 RepID=A0AAD8NCS4_9APIA|nr:hypothetical protein POM88_002628 [Heracleum sosnowskyi]
MEQHHSISCPQFLNLNIRIRCTDSLYGDIKVLASKLHNFTSLGIVSVTFVVPELETANIKLCGWFGDMDCIYRKKYYRLFTDMLSALGNVKNLTFDLDGIEALSATHFLASLPCPFYNLKIVKLPLGYKESSILVLFEATYLPVLQEPALSQHQHFLRHLFAYLQNQGFNVSWALSRLNYIEHLRFSEPLIIELQQIDAHVDDGRTKLQAMQTLRLEKLAEIEKAFGTLGTNLAVGFIGDDLLSCP